MNTIAITPTAKAAIRILILSGAIVLAGCAVDPSASGIYQRSGQTEPIDWNTYGNGSYGLDPQDWLWTYSFGDGWTSHFASGGISGNDSGGGSSHIRPNGGSGPAVPEK